MSKQKEEKEICHVCGEEKKPYTVFLTNDAFSIIQHETAREDGPICERCDQYFAMTGKLESSTEEEFEIAKKAQWFANTMAKWWEQDSKLRSELSQEADNMNKRDWQGTASIARWCRKHLTKKKKKR